MSRTNRIISSKRELEAVIRPLFEEQRTQIRKEFEQAFAEIEHLRKSNEMLRTTNRILDQQFKKLVGKGRKAPVAPRQVA